MIAKPKNLILVGFSPVIINANRAVQKGNIPAARAPASDAGA